MTALMSIIIVGAGPNLGAAVARRFGREDMPVGLIARDARKMEALAGELRDDGITAEYATADIRDAAALSRAITTLADRLGPVEVLEYSPLPAREFMKPILETAVDDVRGPLEFSDQPLPATGRRRDLVRRRGRLRADAA